MESEREKKLIPLVPKLSMSPKLIKKVKRLLEAPPLYLLLISTVSMGTFINLALQCCDPNQLKETV